MRIEVLSFGKHKRAELPTQIAYILTSIFFFFWSIEFLMIQTRREWLLLTKTNFIVPQMGFLVVIF